MVNRDREKHQQTHLGRETCPHGAPSAERPPSHRNESPAAVFVSNQRADVFSGGDMGQNRFHLQPPRLCTRTALECSATQTGRGRDSCHRNVYKSRPEECKQQREQFLSDNTVNFRQSCRDLPVWSPHDNSLLEDRFCANGRLLLSFSILL